MSFLRLLITTTYPYILLLLIQYQLDSSPSWIWLHLMSRWFQFNCFHESGQMLKRRERLSNSWFTAEGKLSADMKSHAEPRIWSRNTRLSWNWVSRINALPKLARNTALALGARTTSANILNFLEEWGKHQRYATSWSNLVITLTMSNLSLIHL